ncbi:MAG: glutathione S-transferase family protein [Novosphingobium sp.]|nr:glutathione S-transferase family protein [Novosphingobium sp.]
MTDEPEKPKTKMVLYGHPFSAYTWKALIALYCEDLEFEFRIVDGDHPEHVELVKSASPLGKFPVIVDEENVIFETTSIIEYVARHYGGLEMLIPKEEDAAIGMRMLDRLFDNYVMTPMQDIMGEYQRDRDNPDMTRVSEAQDKLEWSYAWLDGWLEYYPPMDHVSLIECAAAPSLFYADWVHPIGDHFARLKMWRAHLLRLPAVARCIEEARPYRELFPPGAPDRD